MQTLQAAQNPPLTAKETTTTQELDLKQTNASKGAIKRYANHWHRGRQQSEIVSSSLCMLVAENTPGTDLQTIDAQVTGPERICKESSNRKQSLGSPLLRELVDGERITGPA